MVTRDQIPGISAEEWALVLDYFSLPRPQVMPHDLANQAGVTPAQALAVLQRLQREGSAQIRLLVYHGCSEAPCLVVPMTAQLPTLPFDCEQCDEPVETVDELRFGIDAVFSGDPPSFE